MSIIPRGMRKHALHARSPVSHARFPPTSHPRTWPRPCLLRPLFLLFLVMIASVGFQWFPKRPSWGCEREIEAGTGRAGSKAAVAGFLSFPLIWGKGKILRIQFGGLASVPSPILRGIMQLICANVQKRVCFLHSLMNILVSASSNRQAQRCLRLFV